jgi:hypothetical protein
MEMLNCHSQLSFSLQNRQPESVKIINFKIQKPQQNKPVVVGKLTKTCPCYEHEDETKLQPFWNVTKRRWFGEKQFEFFVVAVQNAHMYMHAFLSILMALSEQKQKKLGMMLRAIWKRRNERVRNFGQTVEPIG